MRRAVRIVFGATLLSAVLLLAAHSDQLFAQQAPDAAATGTVEPGSLSVVQQLALTKEMASIPTALLTAQAAASTALVRASLTIPANTADMTAKAKALAEAELALATARAAAFARVQRSLQPVDRTQIAAVATSVASIGSTAANWASAYFDHTGFTPLFDGKTLDGWEAEAGKWDVQDGTIHRHQTLVPKNFVDFGQYHIFYKEVFADFDLKVEFKIRSGNGGVQYRGRLESGIRAQVGEPARVGAGGGGGGVAIPLRNVAAAIADPLGKPLPPNIKTLDDALEAGLLPRGPLYGNGTGHPWQVSGYQFDILSTLTGNTGGFYEGQGRGTLGNSGEVLYLAADPTSNAVIRTVLGRTSDVTVPQYFKAGDWNQIEIIARGNTLIHILNGRVFCVVVDDDASRRALKGIISLQLEGPADNEIWYRNIWLKKL